MATCAARRPSLDPPGLVAEAASVGATDRMEAISQLESYLSGKPDPEIEPWAMVWAGEQRRLGGDRSVARGWFERAAERYPTHPMKDAAILGMALVDADTSLSGNTLATLSLIDERGVPDTMNADRYRLIARVAADDGSPANKVRDAVKRALDFAAGDPTVEARVRSTLGDLLSDSAGDAPPEATADAEDVALARLRAALQKRDLGEAVSLGQRFQQTWPDSPQLETVKALTRRAEAGDPAKAGRVGLLLPLSGEYAAPGQRLRDAIALANEREGSPLELVVVDTAGDPDKALAGLERLVLKDGCVAVVGPLLKPETQPVAVAAQRFEVPLLALSQSSDVADVGPYVFGGLLTVEQQIGALLDYAMGVRGFNRFAMLYPNNAYGENARDLFASGVQARGGQIARFEGYDPDSGDFRKVAQRLGGKDSPERSSELYRLRRDAERAGDDPSKVMLPPTIDYEAIFIPDNARRVGLVASALAYEEFPVGAFRPRRGATAIPLLGLNGWNSPDLAQSGGLPVRDSIFVDAFLPTDAGVQGFVDAYHSASGRDPMVLDAVVYDSARLLISAARTAGNDRARLRDLLAGAQIQGPVAGGFRFGPDREVERSLYVLTLTRAGIGLAPGPEDLVPPEAPQPE